MLVSRVADGAAQESLPLSLPLPFPPAFRSRLRDERRLSGDRLACRPLPPTSQQPRHSPGTRRHTWSHSLPPKKAKCTRENLYGRPQPPWCIHRLLSFQPRRPHHHSATVYYEKKSFTLLRRKKSENIRLNKHKDFMGRYFLVISTSAFQLIAASPAPPRRV